MARIYRFMNIQFCITRGAFLAASSSSARRSRSTKKVQSAKNQLDDDGRWMMFNECLKFPVLPMTRWKFYESWFQLRWLIVKALIVLSKQDTHRLISIISFDGSRGFPTYDWLFKTLKNSTRQVLWWFFDRIWQASCIWTVFADLPDFAWTVCFSDETTRLRMAAEISESGI